MAKSKNYTSRKHAHADGIEITKYHSDSSEGVSAFIQLRGVYMPVYMPIVRNKTTEEFVNVTNEMKAFKAYNKLRLERTNQRHHGARLK